MHEVVSRYEYRIFARRLNTVRRRLQAMAPCDAVSDSRDIYLLDCHLAPVNNIKVRDGKLEYKKLIERYQGLERWQPAGEWAFPVSVDTVRQLWSSIALKHSRMQSAGLSYEELIHLLGSNGYMRCIHVCKRRYRFDLKDCAAEIDRLLVEGHAFESCAVESGDPQSVMNVLKDLQLTGDTNCSYPGFLCRGAGVRSLDGG